MRSLTAGMQAVIMAGNGTPDCKIELMDTVPHNSLVYSGGPTGVPTAVVAGDGSLVQGYLDNTGHVYVRRVVDPTQSTWGAWTTLYSAANTAGVIRLAVLSDRLRCLWQDSATTNIYYSDSFTNGASWSGAAVLFDAGGTCYGLGADGNANQVFVLYAASANHIRVALWTNSGGWTKADWSNGDSYYGNGLAAISAGGGSYYVATILGATATAGPVVGVASYNGAWSQIVTVVPADIGAGQAASYPHLAFYDSAYHLSYAVTDSGSTDGLIWQRCAVASAVDAVHWSDPLEDSNHYAYGAVALKHSSGYLLAAPDLSVRAPLYTASAVQYRDCTADLVSLAIHHKDDQPARLDLVLFNEASQYTTLAALKVNAQIRVSLGYVGQGVVPTHICYVESYEYVRTADESHVIVVAFDALAKLDRQARASLVYSNQTLLWLTTEVLARAGLQMITLPGTAQFSQSVASFTIPAGHTWRLALERLANLYGYNYAARVTGGGSDYVLVVEKSPSDVVAWTYGDEIDEYRYARNADRANHVLVFGLTSGATTPVGEAWDWTDVGNAGLERLLHLVEPLIANATAAGIRATLEMNFESRSAVAGRIVAVLHPGLEIWDVVTVSDGLAPAATLRVAEIEHQFDPLHGIYDVIVHCEGA